ncbi:hypothetical protein AB0D10_22340 [Kitasatospora sp. NPDC048545]|uniref:hypothetical protein n=1 Tax=Kitasatospora sp. NPDC048545 TaxID=3157208 RepID=UPI0033FC40B4
MSDDLTRDPAAEARHARYGSLPERIRFEDMREGIEAGPDSRAGDPYDPEGAWKFYNCLATDLGL